MKRLHVVGCHRSGTTLIFELLTTCFEHEAHCEHEKTVFNPPEDHVNALYLSKKPSDITHIHRVFRGDPDLYVIYMMRDPRAVVTSVHPSRGDVYFSSFGRWQRYEHAAKPLKGHPRFLEIRYEDLVREPDAVQDRIARRFPFLVKRHAFSEFDKHARTSGPAEISLRGLRPVSDTRLSGWREHLPRLAFQVQRHPSLTAALIEHGYEPDDKWLSILEGVSPREQEYGEKRPPVWQRLETDLRYWLKSRRYLRARFEEDTEEKKRRP